MSANELLVQSAVTLLATGRAERAAEAVSMAAQLIAEVERAVETQKRAKKKRSKTRKKSKARARPRATAKKRKPLPVRALRVLERLKVMDPDEPLDAEALPGKVCEAHLIAAKGCGEATVKQIASWCKAQGVTLEKECTTFDESWLTSRCDEG